MEKGDEAANPCRENFGAQNVQTVSFSTAENVLLDEFIQKNYCLKLSIRSIDICKYFQKLNKARWEKSLYVDLLS